MALNLSIVVAETKKKLCLGFENLLPLILRFFGRDTARSLRGHEITTSPLVEFVSTNLEENFEEF